MSRETYKLSDVMPGDNTLLEGEFEFGGEFSLHYTQAAEASGLQRGEYVLESEFGHAHYAMLSGPHFFAEWGRYRLQRGLGYATRIDQPFIELHFQLEGTARIDQDSLGFDFAAQSGDANLMFVPSMGARGTLPEGMQGAAFSVLFSEVYFTDLAERYPHLLGGFLEKMHREEPFLLSQEHLRVTPQMQGVIRRIRQHQTSCGAGSLFLEAQILELLALQFAQLERPVTHNGRSLSRADTDRIHAARDLLLARLDDPPTLAELARDAGTNEYKLKQGFKAVFGTSPYAYFLQHRLELARTYLLDTDLTVAEITYRVGYRDPAHLTNAFRKQYGIRPSDLR